MRGFWQSIILVLLVIFSFGYVYADCTVTGCVSPGVCNTVTKLCSNGIGCECGYDGAPSCTGTDYCDGCTCQEGCSGSWSDCGLLGDCSSCGDLQKCDDNECVANTCASGSYPFEGGCVECTSNTHCSDTPSTPKCNLGTHKCVECIYTNDCANHPDGPICDDGDCVECTIPEHCTDPTKPSCVGTSCICTETAESKCGDTWQCGVVDLCTVSTNCADGTGDGGCNEGYTCNANHQCEQDSWDCSHYINNECGILSNGIGGTIPCWCGDDKYCSSLTAQGSCNLCSSCDYGCTQNEDVKNICAECDTTSGDGCTADIQECINGLCETCEQERRKVSVRSS